MIGKQRLVCGDHRFTVGDRLQNQATSIVNTTHHLDDHVDRRVVDDEIRIGGQQIGDG